MKKAFLTILILMIILVIINLIPGLNKGLGNFVYTIFSPVERLFSNVGKEIVNFFQVLISIGELNKDNLVLKEKNITMEAEITFLKNIQQENEILRRALNISKSNNLNLEIASIVGKDIQGLQDWILINKGANQGIKIGMTVISPEKALVGRINEVFGEFSKVMLVDSKDSNVAAILENSRTEGLIKKSEKGGIFMDFIPKTEQLQIEERIITSGTDNLYPKGILIGTVKTIDSSDNQIFQQITIAPAINFFKLEYVLVIK